MRATWTDLRLDDFAAHTDRRFNEVDRRFDNLERRMDDGFGELRGEIGSLQRTIIQIGGGLIGTLVVASIGLIATQL